MVASTDTIRYGTHDDQFVQRYRPATKPIGTIVAIHGGYWRERYDLSTTVPLCEHLVASGWTVLNIEYRRVGRARAVWPEMSADVLAAVALADVRPVVAIGHSAGGQLALWAAAQPDADIDAVVALAPVADLIAADELHLSDSATRALFGGSAAELPEVYAAASPRQLLPIGVPQLVVHGHDDDAVPFDLALDYVTAASVAGDDAVLLSPQGVDHFDVIDPQHALWRDVDTVLTRWANERL